jgi:hypothetical protein
MARRIGFPIGTTPRFVAIPRDINYFVQFEYRQLADLGLRIPTINCNSWSQSSRARKLGQRLRAPGFQPRRPRRSSAAHRPPAIIFGAFFACKPVNLPQRKLARRSGNRSR